MYDQELYQRIQKYTSASLGGRAVLIIRVWGDSRFPAFYNIEFMTSNTRGEPIVVADMLLKENIEQGLT